MQAGSLAQEAPSTVRQTREIEDGLELTEKGWVEKVVHPAHGSLSARLIVRLVRLGVPEDAIYDNTRLTPEPDGLRYVPDLMVVLPGNPVPVLPDADYAGAPDLVVEILSPGEANRERDLDEKRRRYAMRAIPHYWIADPATGLVTWLRLQQGAPNGSPAGNTYVAQWTRPLAALALPWPAPAEPS